jgi:hypothetical protein
MSSAILAYQGRVLLSGEQREYDDIFMHCRFFKCFAGMKSLDNNGVVFVSGKWAPRAT